MWLENIIRRSAWELEAARKTIFQFGAAVTAALVKNPIQPWEADLWARGLKTGLVHLEGHFLRVGSGKKSPLSLFIRDERGLYVGLRRESINQAATYVTLITDYGYSRQQTRFEFEWMDVVVYGEDGKPWIYAENKASQRTLEKLCARLSSEFVPGKVPGTLIFKVPGTLPGDAVMKAQHLWRHRPRYFWGVCPTIRLAFKMHFTRHEGFRLEEISTIPSAPEAVLVEI